MIEIAVVRLAPTSFYWSKVVRMHNQSAHALVLNFVFYTAERVQPAHAVSCEGSPRERRHDLLATLEFRMRNKLLFSFVVILTCSCAMFAQNPNYDRCDVGVTNIGKQETRSLGAFETVIGEEERTMKAFALPGTKLFVVASVLYTD